MIFHENRLPADDSYEISCLICYFLKKRQNLKWSSAANYRWRFKGLRLKKNTIKHNNHFDKKKYINNYRTIKHAYTGITMIFITLYLPRIITSSHINIDRCCLIFFISNGHFCRLRIALAISRPAERRS